VDECDVNCKCSKVKIWELSQNLFLDIFDISALSYANFGGESINSRVSRTTYKTSSAHGEFQNYSSKAVQYNERNLPDRRQGNKNNSIAPIYRGIRRYSAVTLNTALGR
jgi:hypothetical protein